MSNNDTWRTRTRRYLAAAKTKLSKEGLVGDALEQGLREATRPDRTTGYVYQVWREEVNLLFHPEKLTKPLGKAAAREQQLLAEWNQGKPIEGGGS